MVDHSQISSTCFFHLASTFGFSLTTVSVSLTLGLALAHPLLLDIGVTLRLSAWSCYCLYSRILPWWFPLVSWPQVLFMCHNSKMFISTSYFFPEFQTCISSSLSTLPFGCLIDIPKYPVQNWFLFFFFSPTKKRTFLSIAFLISVAIPSFGVLMPKTFQSSLNLFIVHTTCPQEILWALLSKYIPNQLVSHYCTATILICTSRISRLDYYSSF